MRSGWTVSGIWFSLLMTGCVTLFGDPCAEVDQEMREILAEQVPPGTATLCARSGDCVVAYPVARDNPRASTCLQPIHRDAAFGYDRFRADGRVTALRAKAASLECHTSEPVCQTVKSAGCIHGRCAYRIEGCTGDQCLVVPIGEGGF